MVSEDLIVVGRLGRTRGIDGELFITPETDFPERFVGLKQIQVQFRDGWKLMELESSRIVSGRPAVKFSGINTPEDAARLTNHLLAVTRAELVELPGDMFYHFDLIGCEVYDESDKQLLGELTDVETYPANDVYVIRSVDGKTLRLPVVKLFVKSVDIGRRRIEIDRGGLFS